MATKTGGTDFYNESYRRRNYFRYPSWIYRPYVSSLIQYCGLKKGDSVLDVGCGQGFFSYLFSTHGLKVHGIDASEGGISAAQELYGRFGISFSVADINTVTFSTPFDCIFVRSCSLYNTDRFPFQNGITDNLLKHLKNNGTFIFAYNSNFSSRPSSKWRYHSLEDVKRHFHGYNGARTFFWNKMMPVLFRKHSFNPFFTRMSILLSRVSGTGGDIVCVFNKCAPTRDH